MACPQEMLVYHAFALRRHLGATLLTGWEWQELLGLACLASTKIADKAIKKAPPLAGSFLICDGLVIADAVVIAAPPIRTPRNEGLSAQPPTIVVGVVIGTVNPDPNTVPKYPMTVMKAVKVVVVVALCKAPVLEPVAAVVPLRESVAISVLMALCEAAAITMLMAMNATFCEPGSAHSRASKITATHSGPIPTAVTARHCTGMATAAITTTMITSTMTTATITAAMHPAAASS